MNARFTCPKCGAIVKEPEKTWQLTAPIPDRKGRITVTIMGIFVCPNCGHRWRGVVSKIKVGGEEVEVEGSARKFDVSPPPKREGKVIELSIEEILSEE